MRDTLRLTIDEIDSLVASAQAVRKVYEDKNGRQDDLDDLLNVDDIEIEIKARPGVWSFWTSYICDGHVWLVRTDRDPWYSEGVHVGRLEGKCGEACRRMLRDIESNAALPSVVVFEGVRWTLQGERSDGRPEYVSEHGWTSREFHDSKWKAGFRDITDRRHVEKKFKSYQEAMHWLSAPCRSCGTRRGEVRES